eukprot:217284-Amorphochlora_amoeboformis.AAC.1
MRERESERETEKSGKRECEREKIERDGNERERDREEGIKKRMCIPLACSHRPTYQCGMPCAQDVCENMNNT